MKLELTITEIAARLGVSERTALRRIADGKLSAKKVGRNKYLVKSEDLDELAPRAKLATLAKQVEALQSVASGQDIQVPSPDREQITALASELSYQGEIIEALKGELAELQARVTSLEQDRMVPQPARSTPSTWPVEARVPRAVSGSKSRSDKMPLPDGWYSWNNFLTRHKLRPQSFDKDDYVRSGEYVSGRASVKDALDQVQQARFVSDHRSKITECEVEGCPCHGLLPGQETLW